jgi:predicted nucleic acid-binding protein
MLQRLTQLDAEEGKKHRDQKNRIRDVLIGHTAINVNATLISDDDGLRQLVSEFGGRAISTSDIKQEMCA